jgi:hypothetical protein
LIGPHPPHDKNLVTHYRAVKEPFYCLKDEREREREREREEEEESNLNKVSMGFLGVARKEFGNGVGREKTHSKAEVL